MTVDQANDALRGFSEVESLAINWLPYDLRYDLTLILTDESRGKRTLICTDISAFNLPRFGGGRTQFMLLQFKDVSANQWDRVTYELHELEDESIFLRCQSFTIDL